MRAVVYRRSGLATEILTLESGVPTPVPQRGELLIRVSHVALNPADWRVMGFPFTLIQRLVKPVDTVGGRAVVPGKDIAGTVVVSNGEQFHVGDEVVAHSPVGGPGGLAEFVALPEAQVVRRPRALSAAESCSFPLCSLTAVCALTDLAVQPSHKLLVLGGSSACGSFAVQWAKRVLRVSSVTATCGAAAEARCRELGADETIDYRTRNWWEVLRGQHYDVILDCVGGPHYEHAHEVLKATGRFGTIAGDFSSDAMTSAQGAWMFIGLARLLWGFAVHGLYAAAANWVTPTPSYQSLNARYDQALLADIARAFDSPEPSARLRPVLDPSGVRDWAEFKAAFALQCSGRAQGKVVLHVTH